MANGKRIQSIECSDIETKPCLDKKRVYRLMVTWFDGSQTSVEATTSTFSSLKNRLKNECYFDRPDVTIPDVPTARPLDALVGLKKTDRKKKAIYDFFEQVLGLPDVPTKWRIMSELFVSPYERRQPAPEYALVNKPKRVPQPPSVYDLATAAGDDDDGDDADAVLTYADLDFSKLPSSACNGKTDIKPAAVVSDSSTLYAEIVPKVSAAAAAAACSINSSLSASSDATCAKSSIVVGNGVGNRVESIVPKDDDEMMNNKEDCSSSSSNSKEHLYLNVPLSGRRCYENLTKVIGEAKTKTFRVAETYIPNTCHSQGLAVEAGDIVQVEVESGGRAFCSLCVDGSLRPMEGWLPTNILRPCTPDGLDSCQTVSVGVDEVGGEPADQGPAVERKKPTASAAASAALPAFPRPAPRNNKQLEIKFNADTQLLDFQRGQLLSPIPSMPSALSPTLKMQPEVREFEERLSLTVVTPQATAPTSKSSPTASRRNDAAAHSACSAVGGALAIQAAAVADYTSNESGVLSFRAGDMGELIYTSDTNWWCIRRGEIHGWVPASYWRIVSEDGRVLGHRRTGSGTACGSQHEVPWMIGTLSRSDCEQLMVRTGRQRDFVIRQSPNLCGQFALSILHRDRVHHFPIVPTNDGKFYIGKHHFSTIYNVVIYYAKSTLFVDDEGCSVTLGRPFRVSASGK